MDFAALPPEINSDRMYSGPGPASLLTAATAWDTLATEHTTLADTYSSVIADLTTAGWRGPTSTMMANAATPLVAWLHNTARLAAQTATQLTAAVGAYETALAATVPPPLVAANRAKLLALIKTNFFGQNSPAIAGVEAHYEEMWAQDATAMYGYRSAAACATRLTPFSQPPQVTNPNGSSAQAAAAAQAVAAGAGHAKDISALPGLTDGLGGLGPPSAAAGSSGLVPVIAGEPVSAYAITGGGSALAINDEVWRLISLGTRMTGFRTAALRDFAQGIGPFDPFFGIPVPPASTTTALPAVPAVSTASAVAGHASQVNSLSVPPAWTVASAADIPANAVPPSHVSTAPGSSAGAPGGTVFGETLAGTLAGRAIAAGAAARPRANPANTVIPRSPAGG